VVRCFTVLLFPFVSNAHGLDTGIVISNTSRDPLGTPVQAGPVTLFYYGSVKGKAAPPQQTSAVVPAGGQLCFTLSSGNPAVGVAPTPGFQGYLFAACEFQSAVGFASLSECVAGSQRVVSGYHAQAVPNKLLPGTRKP
jgi:hypothetical protein